MEEKHVPVLPQFLVEGFVGQSIRQEGIEMVEHKRVQLNQTLSKVFKLVAIHVAINSARNHPFTIGKHW